MSRDDPEVGPGWRTIAPLAALAVAALAIALYVPAHLPFVDFPQHVALVSIWSHLDDPVRGLAGRYEINLATPYVTGYLAARLLSPLVGDELAVRTVLFGALLAIPLASLAVLRTYGRPPELALAAFAVAFAWVTFMGFVPWIVAVPMIIAAVALVRRLDDRRWAAPTLAALAIATFATHALALPALAFLSAAAALGRPGWRRRLVVVAVALGPSLALAGIWAFARSRIPSPDPMHFTMGDPLTRLGLARYLFGSSATEPRVVALTVALLAVGALATWLVARERGSGEGGGRDPAEPTRSGADSAEFAAAPWPRGIAAIVRARPLVWPFLAAAMLYALAPRTALDAYGLWQRFAPIAFVLGLGLLPWPTTPRYRSGLTVTLGVIAIGSSLGTLAQSSAFDRQIAGLDQVVAALPPGARLFYEVPAVRPAGVGVASLRHLSATYLAARGGEIDYDFAMFSHMVVRFRQPRTLATQSTAYDFLLRLDAGCGPPYAPGSIGPEVARAGAWRAYRAVAPVPRPPTSPQPDDLPVGC